MARIEGGSNIVGGTSKTSIAPSYIGNGYIGLGNGSRAYTVGETVSQGLASVPLTVIQACSRRTFVNGASSV